MNNGERNAGLKEDLTPARCLYALSQLCAVAGLVCALLAVWFIFLPNPSGDYLSGMAHVFLAGAAMIAAGVFFAVTVIARVLHRRDRRRARVDE